MEEIRKQLIPFSGYELILRRSIVTLLDRKMRKQRGKLSTRSMM